MEQHTQYYSLLIIRLFHFLLATLVLVSLIYEASNLENRATKLNVIMLIFEGIVLMISIPVIIGHLFTHYRANNKGEHMKIENVILMNFNSVLGIVSCIYNVLVLVEIIIFYEYHDRVDIFNQSARLIFGFLILYYLRLIVKWRPDPDDRYSSISAILSGYITFLCCSFIIGRHFAHIIQLGFTKSNNSNNNSENSNHKNFENILRKIDVFQIVFYLLSVIVIYFHLKNNLRSIVKRQYVYGNWSNITNCEEMKDENEQLIESNKESLNDFLIKLFLQYNFIPFIIGVILIIIMISFFIPIYGTNDEEFGEYYRRNNITKIIIQIICIVLSIWLVISTIQFKVERNNRSKMESFILDLGTMAQIIDSLSHICNNLYKSFFNEDFHDFILKKYFTISSIANLFLIIQVICQRFLFLEILQRKVENICLWKYDNFRQLKVFINPCIILGLVNFGLVVTNIVDYQLQGPESYLKTISNIIYKLSVPFEILNRLHGFTIFLYLMQK